LIALQKEYIKKGTGAAQNFQFGETVNAQSSFTDRLCETKLWPLFIKVGKKSNFLLVFNVLHPTAIPQHPSQCPFLPFRRPGRLNHSGCQAA
jgi:hypothetical protein